MKRVSHKVFGEGVVISNVENKIRVRFEDDSEKLFRIPDSFNLGVLKIDDDWKELIEQNNKEYKEEQSARIEKVLASLNEAKVKVASSKKSKITKVIRTSVVENDYEHYLIKAGYKEETDSGNPSTVSSYVKAVRSVLDEEHMTWDDLVNEISKIIPLYDEDGVKEYLGNKSNGTWINALRRFEEFVKNSSNHEKSI